METSQMRFSFLGLFLQTEDSAYTSAVTCAVEL